MRAVLLVLPLAIPLVGMSAVALGADLPKQAPAPSASAFAWTGFYSGLLAGYGSLDNRAVPICVSPNGVTGGVGCPVIAPLRPSGDDFIAGSEFGYDYQPVPGSGLVFGAALDVQLTRLRGYGRQEGTFPAVGVGNAYPFSVYHVGQRLDSLGTVRGRIGYAFDRLLVYATAGVAAGEVRIDTNATLFGAPQFDGRRGAWRTGYVAGGGFEYAFSQRLSAKIEALYYDLGQRTVLGPDVFGATTAAVGGRVETSGVLARAGLNYRFGEGFAVLGFLNDILAPEPYAPFEASTWVFDSGTRYFYSSGTHRYTLGDPFVPGQTNSRLTYGNFGAHSAESFARLDHNPTGLFLKGFFGSGFVDSGRLYDEDTPPLTVPYSRTLSKIGDGDIAYAAIDAGYGLLRGETYKLGGFVGYQYVSEVANGFGCAQVATNAEICGPGSTVPDNIKGLTEDAHWHALRVGLVGEARYDRFKLSLEGAYLPVVAMNAFDRHWLRPDINPLPQRASGDGYFLEGVVSYDLTRTISVGVGGRYWSLNAESGKTKFPFIPASPTKFTSDRYGAFAQISYKIGDLGFGGL